MSFFEHSLLGKKIDGVHIDSEVTYIMLSDGTQVTIRGLVVVEPGRNVLNQVVTPELHLSVYTVPVVKNPTGKSSQEI